MIPGPHLVQKPVEHVSVGREASFCNFLGILEPQRVAVPVAVAVAVGVSVPMVINFVRRSESEAQRTRSSRGYSPRERSEPSRGMPHAASLFGLRIEAIEQPCQRESLSWYGDNRKEDAACAGATVRRNGASQCSPREEVRGTRPRDDPWGAGELVVYACTVN